MDIWQTIISFLDLLGSILGQYASDPLLYSIAFFIYTFLATIILPLPVEIGLLLSPRHPDLAACDSARPGQDGRKYSGLLYRAWDRRQYA